MVSRVAAFRGLSAFAACRGLAHPSHSSLNISHHDSRRGRHSRCAPVLVKQLSDILYVIEHCKAVRILPVLVAQCYIDVRVGGKRAGDVEMPLGRCEHQGRCSLLVLRIEIDMLAEAARDALLVATVGGVMQRGAPSRVTLLQARALVALLDQVVGHAVVAVAAGPDQRGLAAHRRSV
eukprot:2889723-Prymnesium_polylepis.1